MRRVLTLGYTSPRSYIASMQITDWYHRTRERIHTAKALDVFEEEILSLPLFYVLISLAGSIASLGIIAGNMPVVIGAMIITPLTSPFVGIPLGLVTGRFSIFLKCLVRAFSGTFLFFAVSFCMGVFFASFREDITVVRVESVNTVTFLIAILAGLVAALAIASERVYNRLSGAAIALSLGPPLALAAVDLASQKMAFFWNAITIFGINALGLVVMGLFVFAAFGFKKREEKESP